MKTSILVVFVLFSSAVSLKLDSPKSARKGNEIPEISYVQRVQLIQQETSQLTRGPCAPGETECPTGCCPQVLLDFGFLYVPKFELLQYNFMSCSRKHKKEINKQIYFAINVQNVLS